MSTMSALSSRTKSWLHWTKTDNGMGNIYRNLCGGFGWWAFVAILLGGWISKSGITWLVTPVPNGCVMTYMYPTYIEIYAPPNVTWNRYRLYLYYEGALDGIDSSEIEMQLAGVPVLYIPGNGGSYKQVRSIASEAARAYSGGPLDEKYFQQAVFTTEEAGSNNGQTLGGLRKDLIYAPQEKYVNKLDWFTVDLKEEHSAMNGRILEEHTEFVVHAINRILDRYREALETRSQETQEVGYSLPKNVILVGHSLGGFIARAAVVHPQLRNGAVETILTLSSPHLSAPLPLQPSLGHFYARVNDAWRKGYETPHTRTGQVKRNAEPALSRVVVVSIFGGTQDYQVRSRLASLDDIIPPTNVLTIGTPGIPDVWLSIDHQSIVWCNQVAVQLSHTILQLVDKKTGRPFERPQMRLAVFVTKLRSALPQVFGWLPTTSLQGAMHALPEKSSDSEENVAKTEEDRRQLALDDIELLKEESTVGHTDEVDETSHLYACPKSTHWAGEGKEQDIYIDGPTMTVLAMDGKRRWLDIERMNSNGKTWFTLLTNLAPCSGVIVHLWPAKGGEGAEAVTQQLTEVTMKMVQLPAGPQREMQPGEQSEQPPPTGVLHLSPHDLQGYRFLTISVAPSPTILGRPLPAAPMAVGQFYDPKAGKNVFSPWWIVSSIFKKKELLLRENHPLIADITMVVSLGTLPMDLEINATSCGFADSVKHKPTGDELIQLCKLQCFPPLVLVWDPLSGLEVFPNFYNGTVTVDSSPAMWGSKTDSESTTVLLLVDPHCEYRLSMKASLHAASSRLLLMDLMQVLAVVVAAIFFAMMKQARAWELDAPVTSVFSCIEANLKFPFPYVTLALGPLAVYVMLTVFGTHEVPPLLSFVLVSNVCYIFANGAIAVLALVSMAILYSTAFLQIFLLGLGLRWLNCVKRVQRWLFTFMPRVSTLQVVRTMQSKATLTGAIVATVVRTVQSKATLTVAIVATFLAVYFHPAHGLIVLLLAQAWNCHCALCSYTLSNRQQSRTSRPGKRSNSVGNGIGKRSNSVGNGIDVWRDPILTERADLTDMSYAESKLEVFHQRHGLLLLHLGATIMYIPSLVAGMERGRVLTSPGFLDSSLSFGIIVHGFYARNADANMTLFSKLRLPRSLLEYSGLSFIYGIAGVCCYLSGLTLAPYKTILAMAFVGYLTTIFRLCESRSRGRQELGMRRRYHQRHD